MRSLRPCGTLAAYRRHLRAAETPCGPCAEANRVRQSERRAEALRVAAEAGRERYRQVVRAPVPSLLAVLREDFVIVTEALRTEGISPSAVLSLVKRRQDLAERIQSEKRR